jgi:hypothetical protein
MGGVGTTRETKSIHRLGIKLKPTIFIYLIIKSKMNHIEEARKQVRRYEHRLQQTKDALQLYTELMDNAVLYTWTKAQLKEQEISYAKSLKSAQDSLARIEQSRRERINEMTPEEKRKEYNKLCEERELEKIDYILMYGFDAYEKR